MMKLIKSFLFLVSFLLLSNISFGATSHYIMPPPGTGSHSGADWSNAYSGQPGSFTRGDTYYLSGGAYTSSLTMNTAISGSSVITIKGATTADHGSATGWSNNMSVCVSDGGSQAAFSTSIFNVTTSYWVLDGSCGSGESSQSSSTNYGIGVHNNATSDAIGGEIGNSLLTGLSFSHLEVDGVDWNVPADNLTVGYFHMVNACCLSYSDGAVFDHIYAHELKGTLFFFGGNVTVQNSIVVKLRYTGAWHSEVIAGRGDGGTGQNDHPHFYNNIFKTVGGTGVIVCLVNICHNMEVIGNVFTWDPSIVTTCVNCGGMQYPVRDNTVGASIIGLKFYNNTIYGLDGSNAGVVAFNGGSSGWDIENNIWMSNPAGAITLHDAGYKNNITWSTYISGGPSSDGIDANGNNYICGTAAVCGSANPHDQSAPPSASSFFTNAPVDLTLITESVSGGPKCSPCSLVGLNLGLGYPYNTDINRSVRASDGTWDAGAFEYCPVGCSGGGGGSSPDRSPSTKTPGSKTPVTRTPR